MKQFNLFIVFLLIISVASFNIGSKAPRIHSGDDAEVGEFPYIVSIRRIANAMKHLCAGSLIAEDWVLTSAFCVFEVGTYSIEVIAGEHNLVGIDLHEQLRGVSHIYRHPNYTHTDATVGGMGTPLTNDIALVKLKSPVVQNDFVKVIPMGGGSRGSCSTAGWGTQTTNGLFMTSSLQKAGAPLVEKQECKDIYSSSGEGYEVAEDAFCAGGEGSGPCFGLMWGDCGGPVSCSGSDGVELFGVVSWGIGCGDVGYPWVNTGVNNHRQWIQNIMEQANY